MSNAIDPNAHLCVAVKHQFGSLSLDFSFTLQDQITAVFGPSGSGKTSLLKSIAGLYVPDEGKISFQKKVLLDTSERYHMPMRQRCIGYVSQDALLFPHMNVRQNLQYGANRKNADDERPFNFEHIIDLLQLSGLLNRFPKNLSGGEQQRVAIGRAILSNPSLLLLDEPLASLDEARKQDILPFLSQLVEAITMPVVYVSHSIDEIAQLADAVIPVDQGTAHTILPIKDFLADRQSRLSASGKPESPSSILNARVIAHHDDGLSEISIGSQTLLVPKTRQQIGANIHIRILARDIILAQNYPDNISALNVVSASIIDIHHTPQGNVRVRLAIENETEACELIAQITTRSAKALELEIGQKIYAILKSMALAERRW